MELEKINFSNNQLTEIILPNSNELKKIYLENNLFTTFNYQTLNPTTLTDLKLTNNNLEATELTVFSHLVNLKVLSIGNDNQGRFNQGIYNRFHGSLAPLQSCHKLNYLNISNTDLNAGLEYLPTSLYSFSYSTKLRPQCQVRIIEKALKGVHLFKWRKNNSQLIENGKLLSEYEYQKVETNLRRAFGKDGNQFYWTRNKLTENILTNRNNGFRLWIETKMTPLQTVQNDYYQQIEISLN